jgi:hypothetical protein
LLSEASEKGLMIKMVDLEKRPGKGRHIPQVPWMLRKPNKKLHHQMQKVSLTCYKYAGSHVFQRQNDVRQL